MSAGALMAKRSYPSQRPGTGAERSYPTSEVSGGLEETPHVRGQGWREGLPCVRGQGQQQRGATLHLKSGVAGRSHLAPEARVSGPEEPLHSRGQGQRLGGAT